MVQSLRVFAIVTVVVFAAVGCQKGTQSAAKGKAESSAASTGTKSGESQAKAGKSSDARTPNASAGGSQVGVKGSTLTEADDGAAMDLRLGQVVTVVLGSNHSAGLSWAMAKPTTTVIVPEGKPVYAATPSKAAEGSTGTETWRFRAAKRGQQTVRLEYRRGWQQSVAERTFRFTATVR